MLLLRGAEQGIVIVGTEIISGRPRLPVILLFLVFLLPPLSPQWPSNYKYDSDPRQSAIESVFLHEREKKVLFMTAVLSAK